MLRDDQRERYSRQLLLAEVGARGQARLLASRVDVVGSGRAAEEAAVYLAAAGVGTVELEAPLHDALADRLRRMNADVTVRVGGASDAPRDLLAPRATCAPTEPDRRLAGALAAQATLVALTGAGPPFTWRADAPEASAWHP